MSLNDADWKRKKRRVRNLRRMGRMRRTRRIRTMRRMTTRERGDNKLIAVAVVVVVNGLPTM